MQEYLIFLSFIETLKPKNMKKLVLFLSFLICGISYIQAQCTITPGCTITSGYCSTPAAGSSLSNATVSVAYSTTIQVSIGTSYSAATINSATVTSVTGLPTGLSYSVNPTNGVINGGSSGCMLIAGTPATGTAGSYTVTANVTVNTNFGAFPTTITWLLTVNNAAGIANYSAVPANLYVMPNPAKSEINLLADFNFGKIQVMDVLGNKVATHDANNSYQTTIDISNLNPGVYFLQVIDGTKIITRKFIKE